jgi:hypothetical protein
VPLPAPSFAWRLADCVDADASPYYRPRKGTCEARHSDGKYASCPGSKAVAYEACLYTSTQSGCAAAPDCIWVDTAPYVAKLEREMVETVAKAGATNATAAGAAAAAAPLVVDKPPRRLRQLRQLQLRAVDSNLRPRSLRRLLQAGAAGEASAGSQGGADSLGDEMCVTKEEQRVLETEGYSAVSVGRLCIFAFQGGGCWPSHRARRSRHFFLI